MPKRSRTDSSTEYQEYKSINSLVDDVFKTKTNPTNKDIDKASVIFLNYIKNLHGFDEFINNDKQSTFIRNLFNYINKDAKEKHSEIIESINLLSDIFKNGYKLGCEESSIHGNELFNKIKNNGYKVYFYWENDGEYYYDYTGYVGIKIEKIKSN